MSAVYRMMCLAVVCFVSASVLPAKAQVNRMRGTTVWLLETQKESGAPWVTRATYTNEQMARNRLHFLVEHGTYYRVRIRRSVRYARLASRNDMARAVNKKKSTPSRSVSTVGSTTLGGLRARNPLPKAKKPPFNLSTSKRAASTSRTSTSKKSARTVRISPIPTRSVSKKSARTVRISPIPTRSIGPTATRTITPTGGRSVRSGDGETSDPTRSIGRGRMTIGTLPVQPGRTQPRLDPFRGIKAQPGTIGTGPPQPKYLLQFGTRHYGQGHRPRLAWTDAGVFDKIGRAHV